jgi:RHS repeat-associated protein
MKNRIFLNHLLIGLMIFMNTYSKAQNIPNNSTTPVGSITPYLPANFTAGIKVNSVRSIVVKTPIQTESGINIQSPTQTSVSTKYSDGLGRIVQTVDHFESPFQRDLVTLTKYDNLGNEPYQFLPYTKEETSISNNGKFKLTAFNDQKFFYKGSTMGYGNDWYFYTKTNFNNSPQNKPVKEMAQGNAWVGRDRGVTTLESGLPANANIRVFTIAYTPGSLPISTKVYNTGELTVRTTTDEDGYFIEEYINKESQVVLKTTGKTGNATKLYNYYVYDYAGLLRYVIPPKAVTWLSTNSWTLTATIAAELCYNVEYDIRKRPIVKSKPGAGADYFVYNQKDELVFSQTPLQRAKGEWIFIKRDALSRVIQSGVYNSTATQATLHNYINTTYSGTDPLILYLNNKTTYGTSTYVTSFTTAKVYVTDYYDDYSFTTRTYDATHMSKLPTTESFNSTLTQETTNLVTGTKVLVLDGATTPTELVTVHFYNDRGLLIQSQAQNHKGGWNYVTSCYNFIGQTLASYTEINNPQATDNAKIRMLETYTYDHAGRLKEVYHSLNDAGAVALARNEFDEINRIVRKSYSNAESAAYNYEYNVRNWLTAINRYYCLNGTGSEAFGMELSYESGYTTNYFNGSTAGMKWRNMGKATELRSYGYTYDGYNRLKSGDFVFKTGAITSTAAWSNATKDYTANNIIYDENGNLQSMKQMGVNGSGQKIILDDLSYIYKPNSNKLERVAESSSSQSQNPTQYDNLGDFRDVANTTDYTYDAAGNILTDANKSLSFVYDEILNKTKRTTKGSQNVDYLYDALGNKLQKKVSGGSTTTTTDYVAGATYINNALKFISHAEGRIRYDASAPTSKYMYDFFIKDHLGNTRSVVTYTTGSITGFAATTEEAVKPVIYLATSEPDNSAKENQLFDNIDNTRSLKLTDRTPEDSYVSKITARSEKTILGPDITLKVMSGDVVKISAEALVIKEKNNPKLLAENVINNFLTAFTSLPTLVSEGLSTVAATNTMQMGASILNMQHKNSEVGAPKAFLNYLLYDEYMNLVPGGSGVLQVKNKEGWQKLEIEKLTIPQNGFLRVFSSNLESAPVSINNTMVALVTGKLVEEYNYYPYGLVFDQTQAATSIRKTDYLFNGKELQRNEFGAGNGMELVDYGARLYDPQIGRWHAVDAMAAQFATFSPYNYALDNPVTLIDPDGNEVEYATGPMNAPYKSKEMDAWYLDSEGNPVYGKNISSQEDLDRAGIDGTFLGAQGYVVNKDGTMVYANPDGTMSAITLNTVTVSPSGLKQEDKKGYDFDHFIDDVELSADITGPIGAGAKKILENRGAYMPRGEIYKINKEITIRTPVVNINTTSKVLKAAKVTGKVLAVANVAATVYEVRQDWQKGRYKASGARIAVATAAMAAGCIPVVGWGVALTIGVADYIWGDDFYNWVEGTPSETKKE